MKTIIEDLTEMINLGLKEFRLRPNQINIPDHYTKFTKRTGSFIMVSLYWDEYYFDKLVCSPTDKINNLCREIEKQIESPREIQIGTSDGHLFFIFIFTDEEMESEAEKIFNQNHPELNP